MKFNYRKIASVMGSALMMGSTVALAAAASFPAPFVQNGAANVGIVYGSNAASSDLVAAADIQSALSEALASQGGSGSVEIEGESYPLFGSGNSKLWFNSSLNSQRSTVTDSDMPITLAETDLSGNVDADITHQIKLGSFPRLTYGQAPTSDDDPVFHLTMSTSSSNYLYNSTVIFDQAVNFTHSDTEGETFTMFGQEFTVAAATDGDTLVLFRSSQTVYLDSSSNPSQTVEVDGETYTIDLVSASDTGATIRVTDSSGNTDQKEINEAASKKIAGLEVSVNNADESDALGTISAEVIVGANKLTIQDGGEVLFGTDETSIDGTNVDLTTSSPTSITQMTFQATADDTDEDALVEGGSFMDPVFEAFRIQFANLAGDDSREMIEVQNSGDDKMTAKFTNHEGNEKNFNFIYNATVKGGPDIITAGAPILGDNNGRLINVREMAQVNDSHYVVLGNEDEGYLLEADITNSTTGYTSDSVKFKDVFSDRTYEASLTAEGSGTVNIGGNTYTVTYSGSAGTGEALNVRVNDAGSSGNAMRVYNTIETELGAKVAYYQPLKINITNWDGASSTLSSIEFPDGDGFTSGAVTNTAGGNFTFNSLPVNASGSANLTDSVTGLIWNVANGGEDVANIYLISPNTGAPLTVPGLIVYEEEDHLDKYRVMVVESEGIGTSTDGLGVNRISSTSPFATSFITHDSDTDVSSAADLFGSIMTLDAGESDQKTAKISYPDEQINAEIYVVAADATTSGGSDLGSITVMDSEVSQVSGKNLIVVGGSCVNEVAATLLGSDSPICSNNWQSTTGVGAGQFLIQTFSSPFTNGRVATLVAGYNAGDTTNAATFFTTQNVETDAGDKYVGSSATSASLVTN